MARSPSGVRFVAYRVLSGYSEEGADSLEVDGPGTVTTPARRAVCGTSWQVWLWG